MTPQGTEMAMELSEHERHDIPMLPCRWCGEKEELAVHFREAEHGRAHFVTCYHCGAAGPTKDSVINAVKAWNAPSSIDAGGWREPFQQRVQPWMMACFGEKIAADKLERDDRFLEEVLESLQAGGYPPERVTALRDYVYGRPAGDPDQEIGGVMVTLAARCLAYGLDMHAAGERELARINRPEISEKIRAKQAAKPTGSALPIAVAPPLSRDTAEIEAALERLADKVQRQAECLIHYAEQNGEKDKPVPSVYHIQASHFMDFAQEARAALASMGRKGA